MSTQPYKGMIGIYGGTFDPIHFGHLNLAIEMFEAHDLAGICFCPVNISPHKLEQQPTAGEHRLKMLELAIEGIPNFYISTMELNRSGPSYTLETLQAFIAQESQSLTPRQFCLILGEDALPGFVHWHQPEEIIKLVPILIGRRTLIESDWNGSPEIYTALVQGMTPTSLMDISSRNIRKRLQVELYCGHLLPAKVIDYIYSHQLYLSNK